MPITVEARRDLDYVLVIYSGQVTDEEFIDHAKMVAANDEWLAMRHWLLDGRNAIIKDNISAQALKRASEIFASVDEKRAGTKVAFVATSDAAFAVSRMFELQRGDSPLDNRVFRDMNKAMAWLGLPS